MDQWTIPDLTAWAHRAAAHLNNIGEMHDSKGKLTKYGKQLNGELATADDCVRWICGD